MLMPGQQLATRSVTSFRSGLISLRGDFAMQKVKQDCGANEEKFREE